MSQNNELYHYGVLGMKWGKRKALPKSDLRKRYDSAKATKKAANKQYSKDFNKAYNYSERHPIGQYVIGKIRKEADSRWDKSIESAKAANKADAEYRKIKKERKNAINKTYKKINKDTSSKERIFYNDATRKKAAKYVIDNNMSMADAKNKANKEAIRNTAILLGAIGAYSLAIISARQKVIKTVAENAKFKTTILDANGKVIARKFASSVVR